MKIIGLTGGIGMGKTTTANFFAEQGVPVWDADRAVHRLYLPNSPALPEILARFPLAGSLQSGIDRQKLSELVLNNPEELAALEAIVHPLVGIDQTGFVEAHRAEGYPAVVLDIPLLFEGGAQDRFDAVVLCSTDEKTRRDRVLAREGMTPDKLDAIISRQMPDADKRLLADYVVETGEGLEQARRAVQKIVEALALGPLDGESKQPET